MVFINRHFPGVEAAFARYMWGPLTLIGALVALINGVSVGTPVAVLSGIGAAVSIAAASYIPFSRDRTNVTGLRGAGAIVLYLVVLFIGIMFYANGVVGV